MTRPVATSQIRTPVAAITAIERHQRPAAVGEVQVVSLALKTAEPLDGLAAGHVDPFGADGRSASDWGPSCP